MTIDPSRARRPEYRMRVVGIINDEKPMTGSP